MDVSSLGLLAWALFWLEPHAPKVLGENVGRPLRLANIARHSSSVAVAVLSVLVSRFWEGKSLEKLATCNIGQIVKHIEGRNSLVNVPGIADWGMQKRRFNARMEAAAV